MTLDEQRRLSEAEATIRELVRLATIAEVSPSAVAIADVFDRGQSRDEWALAWEHARRIATRR